MLYTLLASGIWKIALWVIGIKLLAWLVRSFMASWQRLCIIVSFVLFSSGAFATITMQPVNLPLGVVSVQYRWTKPGIVLEQFTCSVAQTGALSFPSGWTQLEVSIYDGNGVSLGRVNYTPSMLDPVSLDGQALTVSFGGSTFGAVDSIGTAGTIVNPFASGTSGTFSGEVTLSDPQSFHLEGLLWGVWCLFGMGAGFIIFREVRPL